MPLFSVGEEAQRKILGYIFGLNFAKLVGLASNLGLFWLTLIHFVSILEEFLHAYLQENYLGLKFGSIFLNFYRLRPFLVKSQTNFN